MAVSIPKLEVMKVPRKPLKPCRYPQCPVLTEETYCDKHQTEMKYKRDRKAYSKLYDTSRWQRLRQYVLGRQPLCRKCLEAKRITPATVVDHIKPHRGDESLFFDEANLQALCKSCHDRKTAKEDGRWQKKVYTY